MNKKIIIILTLVISLGGISSVFVIRYRSKNQDSLEVKEEEKKEESKSEEKEAKEEKKKEEEEEEHIPNVFTWKGGVRSLLTSVLISFVIAFVIAKREKKCRTFNDCDIYFIASFFAYFFPLLFLLGIAFPFLLALKKFGKKSYLQRLLYSKKKIIIDVIVVIVAFIGFFVTYFVSYLKFSINFSNFLKEHYHCCCEEKKVSKNSYLENEENQEIEQQKNQLNE